MRKVSAVAVLFVFVLGYAAYGRAQDAPPGEPPAPEQVTQDEVIEPGDDILSTAETTMVGDPTSEGGDEANVINPGEALEGKVQVKYEADAHVSIYRSGALVEKIPFTAAPSDECASAYGQIGKVEICGTKITLMLTGRPPFDCPAPGAGDTISGACVMKEPEAS